MLKLSLGMRVTNSRRENTRRELDLGVRVAQLVEADLGRWLATHHPDFRLVPDPAWIGVDTGPDGAGCGLDIAVRVNPISARDRVVCVAALVADSLGAPAQWPQPTPQLPPSPWQSPPWQSPLVRIVTTLAGMRGCPRGDAAAAWFTRYLDVLATPVFGLYLDRGVGVEAHHQNTLVTLDDEGLPVAGWYRDSQGYYVAASRAAEAEALVPGFGDGVDAFFDDAFVEDRLVYYTVVNNIFGVIGALGAGGVADEPRLLGIFRTLLARLAAARHAAGRPPARLLATLLESPTLPCKGNLLTCVDGRDEVVEPTATQSVYIEIPNPLVEAEP
jgi:siderophore synthetase component